MTDWTFGGTWPYEPRWFDTPDGRLHYVDHGPRDGQPVVLFHGNPTWGYLYRNFIGPLAEAGYRAIAPDHLGFGRSDKPEDPELYRIPRHAERTARLLDSLDLDDVTLVGQDWGGPIGFSWARHHPDRVSRLVVMNTFAHRPPRKVPLPLALKACRVPVLGELLVKRLHLFVRLFLFVGGIMHRDRLTDAVRRAYLTPHPDAASRTGVLVFPREIPSGPEGRVSDFLAEVHEGLQVFQDRPVFIAWAFKDPAFVKEVLTDLWLKDFPHARLLELPDAGHFLQEDAHERIVPELLEFLGET